jgi:protein TonB
MKRLLAIVLLTGCWSSSSPEPAKPEPAPEVKKQPVKDIVQEVKIEKQEEPDPCGDPCGGVVGGVVGGVPGGVVGGAPPPPPPPPPPPSPAQNIPPTMLETQRIAGDKAIVPNDVTKVAIARSGKEKLVGSWKLCLDDTGAISQVTRLKSTGFNDYDTKIETEMRSNWKYKAYVINSRPVPVCTAITFIYSQPLPPPPPPKTP